MAGLGCPRHSAQRSHSPRAGAPCASLRPSQRGPAKKLRSTRRHGRPDQQWRARPEARAGRSYRGASCEHHPVRPCRHSRTRAHPGGSIKGLGLRSGVGQLFEARKPPGQTLNPLTREPGAEPRAILGLGDPAGAFLLGRFGL